MLKNLCGNKRKNKPAKFSENLNALSIQQVKSLLSYLQKKQPQLFQLMQMEGPMRIAK
jgi:hypothetical protein